MMVLTMPIGKVICSSSFTATTRYVLKKEQAQWLGGTMLGENAEELTLEFEFSRRNNPTIERPCLHLILSYSKMDEQRQKLDNTLLAAIAQEHFVGCAVLSRWHQPLAALDPEAYRQQLETFKKEELHHYQMFAAVHEDVHHRHTHTVGSRINVLDGKCLETWQNRLKSQYVIRELEERYGLEINQSSGAKDRRGLSRRQLEKQSKTGRKPVQLELQETLDTLLPQVTTVAALGDALRQSGVDMRLYQRATGELYGVSYEKDGVAFRGSDLGKKYSFKNLKQSLAQNLEADEPTLILESVTQPAIEPALTLAPEPQPVAVAPALIPALETQPAAVAPVLILESVTQPVAVAPALIPALKTQPAAVAPALEQTGEPNHDEVQQLCLQKLPSLVAEIWRYYQERYPKAKGCEVDNGNYRIAAGEGNNPPTLLKHGTERLEWLPTEGRYQVNGLTLADYEAIQRQAQKVRFASIETVAPLMAKFLEQQGIKRWKEPDSTYGLTRQDDLLTYYKQQERTIVYQAQLKQGHWTAITGQVPPEVEQNWLAWQRQEKAKELAAAKVAAKDKGR